MHKYHPHFINASSDGFYCEFMRQNTHGLRCFSTILLPTTRHHLDTQSETNISFTDPLLSERRLLGFPVFFDDDWLVMAKTKTTIGRLTAARHAALVGSYGVLGNSLNRGQPDLEVGRCAKEINPPIRFHG